MKTILVTGGAGFIGSHTSLLLLKKGFNLIILDSFLNSNPKVIERISELSGIKNVQKRIELIKGDIRDQKLLERLFDFAKINNNPIDAVIHFAGLKSVSDSLENPFEYWEVNVLGTIKLLQVMEKNNCFTIIFSSSATIYGVPKDLPLKEISDINPLNTYGETKAAIEKIFRDVSKVKSKKWRMITLRYFNPVGAHPTGKMGEDPLIEPNNLFPYISQVAIGRKEKLRIFGNNWPTFDGTCIRDYIHIMDLAESHIASLEFLLKSSSLLLNLNIGTGIGRSVLEIVKTFEKVNNLVIPYSFVERREGDIAVNYADNKKALSFLNWRPIYTLEDMCRDSWKWQKMNPNGYK